MIIFRYLSKEILTTLLAATLILLVLFITSQSVQFLQRAASGLLPATELLRLITLEVPLLLGYLIPLGLYLAILLTFGRLYMDSEMTVLAACGVSRFKITLMVLAVACFVAIIVAWLMAIVVPKAQGDINLIENTAAVTASVEQIIPDRFMVFGKSHEHMVFYAAKSEKNHRMLENVFLAKRDKAQGATPEHKRWDVVVAQYASEKALPDQSGRYLILQNGYRYLGEPGTKDYRVMQFDRYSIRLSTNDIPEPNAAQCYSMKKLWDTRNSDHKSAAEFQWRIAMPISTILFALLAVPLSEVRPRYGKFTQLFPAMLIYISYADLILLTRAWIRVGRISPALGMWWVHGCALLLAMALILYRVGWYRIRRFLSVRRIA